MNTLLNLIKNHWVSLTLLTLVTITALSLWPLKNLPPIPGTDKTHHLIAYAALMFPVALRRPRRWIVLALLFVAYSGVIEMLQPYMNRYGEWLDLAANATGVACGIITAGLINHHLRNVGA
jgi:VanZ family protein